MNFDVSLFWDALISWPFLRGALVTLLLTILAHTTALVISVPAAIICNGPKNIIRKIVRGYVTIFRAIPTLLQLLIVWNALPQLFPIFLGGWFTPFVAAWLALSINEGAYQTEINRAALMSVDAGQMETGRALGIKKLKIYRHIILPQAMRIALPPTLNEFITLLKMTSLATIISLHELMTVTQISVARTFDFTEYYAVALIYYVVMVFILLALAGRIQSIFAWADSATATAKMENTRHG